MVFSRILTWRVSRRRWIRWRQCWMSFKGRRRRLDDKLERVKAVRGRAKEWPADPVEFCVQYLGFKLTVRQSKIIIRKITNFLPIFPKYVALKPLKTKIEFYSGSRIQAFPNSPETIRGEAGVNLLYATNSRTSKMTRTSTKLRSSH